MNWLSDPSVTRADDEELPESLTAALGATLSIESAQIVVMNAIMPTAMVVTYTQLDNSEAAASSAMTARRGVAVLRAASTASGLVSAQVQAAIRAADGHAGDGNTDAQTQFWVKFYEKWGYEAAHVAEIKKLLSTWR